MLSENIDTDKWRHRLLVAAFEAVLIMLGVLLGLAANQWRNAQKNERKADAALRAIREEVRGNCRQIKDLLPYHQRVDDSLDVLSKRVAEMQKARVSVVELQQALPNGFETALLQRNAWELAGRTGALNHIDFELATALSDFYSQQAFYKGKLDKAGENWYVAGNLNPDNFAATAMATGILVNDVVFQEEDLTKQCPNILDRLDRAGQ